VAGAAPARGSRAAGPDEPRAAHPEGVSPAEAIAGIDLALGDGLPVLVFSFHSPSLRPGNTPYVRDDDQLDQLYGWWRTVFAHLARRGVRPAGVAQIMQAAQI
jgi:hypothetical protein